MSFINKSEKTDTIKNGKKLQLDKDVEVEITSYKEARKWVIKWISMEISDENLK